MIFADVSSSEDFIQVTDVEADLIAMNLRKTIDIPMIQNSLERLVVRQVIKATIDVGPLVLPEGTFNQLVSGEQDMDAFLQKKGPDLLPS